jgi:DNA-directed RNA polymerase subunit RPC12/RpoP
MLMVIYNYCSRCGRKIKIDIRDPVLSLSLESTKKAVCNDCDPQSRWVPVYPKIEGEGKLGDWSYRVVELEVGKGLVLTPPKGRSIYLAPLAPQKELESIFAALPDHIRQALSEFELVKRLKRDHANAESVVV